MGSECSFKDGRIIRLEESRKPLKELTECFQILDDRYENGVHDLMKFVKFGYGRCSDMLLR